MQTSLCDVIDRTLWIGVVCAVIKPLVALIHTHTHLQAKEKEAALPAGWWIAARPVLPPSRHVCVSVCVGGILNARSCYVIKILYKMRIRESPLSSWLASCPVAPCRQLCRAAGVDQMKMSRAAPTHTLTHTYSCHIFRSLYILILLLHTHAHTLVHTYHIFVVPSMDFSATFFIHFYFGHTLCFNVQSKLAILSINWV